MVCYFSATGNSRWIAAQLAERAGVLLVSIADIMRANDAAALSLPLSDSEYTAIVSPIHAWGLPRIVEAFMRHVTFRGYDGQPIDIVLTCGDDCGRADEQARHLMRQRGWQVGQIVALQMPNTYVPLFDTDGPDLEAAKRQAAAHDAPRLIEQLVTHRHTDHYIRLKASWLKTYVIHPLFYAALVGDRKFHVSNRCTGCATCKQVCPVGNIDLTSDTPRHPEWHHHCIHCMACYHYCPTHAINYGRATNGRGQYTFNTPPHHNKHGKETT